VRISIRHVTCRLSRRWWRKGLTRKGFIVARMFVPRVHVRRLALWSHPTTIIRRGTINGHLLTVRVGRRRMVAKIIGFVSPQWDRSMILVVVWRGQMTTRSVWSLKTLGMKMLLRGNVWGRRRRVGTASALISHCCRVGTSRAIRTGRRRRWRIVVIERSMGMERRMLLLLLLLHLTCRCHDGGSVLVCGLQWHVAIDRARLGIVIFRTYGFRHRAYDRALTWASFSQQATSSSL
jgi:hypothetical protein